MVVKVDARAYPGALNVLYIALDGHDGLLIWGMDAVPDTQVASALRHHHVTARNPLHIAAEWQKGGALLLGNVEDVQVALLVTEKQVRCPSVQLLQDVTVLGACQGCGAASVRH